MLSEITSLQHPLVKEWVKIRTDKEARKESKSILLIGEKMVRELSPKLSILITTRPSNIKASHHYLVTEEILKKITGLPSPDGFAAIAPLPEPQPLEGKKRILILDRIADPGNLGTLLRTALAFNWDGVIFTPGTVDPFNDKALRASKGALFSLPYSFNNVKPLYTFVADLDGPSISSIAIPDSLALVLSNEGSGPGNWENVQKVSIPMGNCVESLNVAAAGAILLHAMRSQ